MTNKFGIGDVVWVGYEGQTIPVTIVDTEETEHGNLHTVLRRGERLSDRFMDDECRKVEFVKPIPIKRLFTVTMEIKAVVYANDLEECLPLIEYAIKEEVRFSGNKVDIVETDMLPEGWHNHSIPYNNDRSDFTIGEILGKTEQS